MGILRLFARLGVPIAPYPYWPTHMLMAFVFCLIVLTFAGLLQLVELIEAGNELELASHPVRLLKAVDYSGFLALAVVLAPRAAWRHRRVASRAGLPPWSEV